MQVTAPSEARGQRLDLWLTPLLDLPRAQVQKLLKAGAITLDGQPARANLVLKGGERVNVALPEEASPERPAPPHLTELYRDEDVVVIDKPAGLLVHPGHGRTHEATVADYARTISTDPDPDRPGIVHRLDRDTSGLMLLARTPAAKTFLQAAFHDHAVRKTYLLLVSGRMRPESAVIDLPLARSANDPLRRAPTPTGKPARTAYRVDETLTGYSLVSASPLTGRTHQLRAHFAATGHPIAGDARYGGPHGRDGLPGLTRQFLHAARLELTLPSGRPLVLESPLPHDLAAVLQALRQR